MTPDAKRRQSIAAAIEWDSYQSIWRDIRAHTIPQGAVVVGVDMASGQDMSVVACSRCGTPTTRHGLCSACANPEVVR
jgi:hypothetical protein